MGAHSVKFCTQFCREFTHFKILLASNCECVKRMTNIRYAHHQHHNDIRAEWVQPVLDWAVGHINSGSMVIIMIIFVHNIITIDLTS